MQSGFRVYMIFALVARAALTSSCAHAEMKNFAQKLPEVLAQAKPAQAPVQHAAKPVLAPKPQLVMPLAEDLLDLIRTTIVALNQANQSGNYTVLRDLAAPDFSRANDASRLGLIFQVLREQAIDLSPLLHISPEVSEAPAINTQGFLRLAGFFPTVPLRVNFDLSFQYIESRWRPYSISVYVARVEAQLPTSAAPQKAAARAK
jgi:hypothetical protein